MSDTVKNAHDMERLISFMRTLDECGVERPCVVKWGYDFALAACCARIELGMPTTLTTLTYAMQVLTMEDAAQMLELAIDSLRIEI